MKTITQEDLIKLLVSQCRSADLWIACWNQHKDAPAMRNAAIALGKIHGIYNVLIFMTEGFDNVPESVIELVHKYQDVWDSLSLP